MCVSGVVWGADVGWVALCVSLSRGAPQGELASRDEQAATLRAGEELVALIGAIAGAFTCCPALQVERTGTAKGEKCIRYFSP